MASSLRLGVRIRRYKYGTQCENGTCSSSRGHRRSLDEFPRSYSSKEAGIIHHQPISIHRKLSGKTADSIRQTLKTIPPSRRGNLQAGIPLLGDFDLHLRNRNVHHAQYCRGAQLEGESSDGQRVGEGGGREIHLQASLKQGDRLPALCCPEPFSIREQMKGLGRATQHTQMDGAKPPLQVAVDF